MYSKTRNTLIALTAAVMFVTGSWLFSRPASGSSSPPHVAKPLVIVLHDAQSPKSGAGKDAAARNPRAVASLRSHRSDRLSLNMPYFSFVHGLPERGAD